MPFGGHVDSGRLRQLGSNSDTLVSLSLDEELIGTLAVGRRLSRVSELMSVEKAQGGVFLQLRAYEKGEEAGAKVAEPRK